MIGNNRTTRTMAMALGLILGAGQALAVDRFWVNPSSGSWTDGANWSGGAVPGASDSAMFNLDGSYTVSDAGGYSVGSLELWDGNVALRTSGGQFDITGASGGPLDSLLVGRTLPGGAQPAWATTTLHIGGLQGGRYTTPVARIGAHSSTRGRIQITGSSNPFGGSTAFFEGGSLIVGDEGEGEMALGNRTRVDFASIIAGAEASGSGLIVVGGGTTIRLARVRAIDLSTGIYGDILLGPIGSGEMTLASSNSEFECDSLHLGDHPMIVLGNPAAFGRLDMTNGAEGRVFKNLFAGSYGEGVVHVGENALLEVGERIRMGIEPTGRGEMTITGAGARVIYGEVGAPEAASVVVGDEGDGELTIEGGGRLLAHYWGLDLGRSSTGYGGAWVTGPGSRLDVGYSTVAGGFIQVGIEGAGELHVLDNAAVTANGPLILGFQPGAFGEAHISGGASMMLNGMQVGRSGDGVLFISSGSTVTTSSFQVGFLDDASGFMAIDDAAVVVQSSAGNSVEVGRSAGASGELHALNGATISSAGGLRLASLNDGDAAAWVDGAGSMITLDRDLFVYSGSTLDITNGGAVECRRLFIYNSVDSGVTIVGADSKLTADSDIVSVGSQWENRHGLLGLYDGAEIIAPSSPVNVWEQSALTGDGFVRGDLVNQRGEVAPDSLASGDAGRFGILTVDGDFTQLAQGALRIDINHDVPGAPDSDLLAITGDASLDGELIIEIVESSSASRAAFDPATGTTWDILTAANVFGTFATESLPALPGDKFFEVEYEADRVRLRVTTSCPADLTGDGQVGSADLGALLGTWGPCPAPCDADLTNSGDVGSGDLGVLLGSWGPCP